MVSRSTEQKWDVGVGILSEKEGTMRLSMHANNAHKQCAALTHNMDVMDANSIRLAGLCRSPEDIDQIGRQVSMLHRRLLQHKPEEPPNHPAPNERTAVWIRRLALGLRR